MEDENENEREEAVEEGSTHGLYFGNLLHEENSFQAMLVKQR
jgi:hypothetical protein